MKKTSTWLLALLSLVSVAGSQTGAAPKKLSRHWNKQWLQGQKTNNPDLVAPLLADKIVVTEADGKVSDKAEMLAFYKNTKCDSAEYDDVKVTVFGDTALFRAVRAEIRLLSLLEASGSEQDLRETCQGGLVSDEMSVIADRRIRATGGTRAVH